MKSSLKFSLAAATLAIGSVLTAPAAHAQTTISFFDVNPTFTTNLAGVSTVNTPTTATISGGGNSIVYQATATAATPNVTQVNPPEFSNQNLGVFTLTLAPGANFTIPTPGTSFALTVTQTVPTPNGSQTLTSIVNGQVIFNASTGAQASTIGLAFSTSSFNIGDVTYALNNLTNSGGFSNVLLLGPGTTTFSVRVTAAAVPEPSTLAMAGMGGLSLLGYGWRRRRKLAIES